MLIKTSMILRSFRFTLLNFRVYGTYTREGATEGWIQTPTLVALFVMHKWQQSFAFKTELRTWIFVLAGIIAMGITILTVSWQRCRAATRNPVEALRYE
jgi:hypothetical protein